MTHHFIALAAASLATFQVMAAPRNPIIFPRQSNETIETAFSDIVPSSNLSWVDCYQQFFPGYQCAYLTVPLDYEDRAVGTIDVAFIRYLISDKNEDLLINPGRPGVSGVGYLIGQGDVFAEDWGYNPVSFDPRGVGQTKPLLSCALNNHTSSLRRRDGSSNDLLEEWNEALARNEKCTTNNANTTAKYAGTLAVVQDLMHFTGLQASARAKDPKPAKINYYGASYGTLLGQTLVAWYPNRLGRIMLDANVYGVAHYQGWEPSGIDDFSHAIWMFARLCYEAGELCPLTKGALSINEGLSRFDEIVQTLRTRSIQCDETDVDLSDFILTVQSCMYSPRPTGQGQDRSYLTVSRLTATLWNTTTGGSCELEGLFVQKETEADEGDALRIITAVDIAGRYPWADYQRWKAAVDRLDSTARYYAQSYGSSNGLIGIHFDTMPPPSQNFPGFERITPNAAILFVNPAGDPVTPTTGARQMARLFRGSGFLIVDGPGQSYRSAPSECAQEIIAGYFKDGTVPQREIWCGTSVTAESYFRIPG